MRWELSISPFNATGQFQLSRSLIAKLTKVSRRLDHLALSFNGGKDCESIPPAFLGNLPRDPSSLSSSLTTLP